MIKSAFRDSKIAEEALSDLRRHVVEPLRPRCVDVKYGGFLVDFDERWRPAGPHEKTLEHAARMTCAFAMLDRALPGEGCDELARHGCAFLREAMWDASYGGFFAKVDRTGRPLWEGLKHPHAATYAAQAFLLSEPLLPSGEGREWAARGLSWLDEVAWDPVHGGYWGSFRRDNERYADKIRLPTSDGLDVLGMRPGFKEINTQGDAIEMLTEFALVGAGGSLARLQQLVDLVVNRLIDPAGALPYLYRRDWRPAPDLVRVGFHFQNAHRIARSAAVLRDAPLLVARAGELLDFGLTAARHPSGGFCFAVSADGRTWPATGPSSDLRQWWVQLEAVRALHALGHHEGIDDARRARFLKARNEQWTFVRETLLDGRYGGIRQFPREPGTRLRSQLSDWLPGRASTVQSRFKTHGWKDPMHEVGVLISLLQTVPTNPLASRA